MSQISASSSSTSQAASPTTWSTHPAPKSASTWSYAGAKVPAWAANPPNQPAPIQPAPTSVPTLVQPDRASIPPTAQPAPPVVLPRPKKRKHRTMEEQTIMKETTVRLATLLAEDTKATLNPDINSPFKDAADVVKRLLPYHIWQHPAEDLDYLRWPAVGKGKGRATEQEILKAEIAETRFAIQCEKRKRDLEKEFRRITCNQGKREAPDSMMYTLAHNALESERSDATNLTIELRTARTTLDQLQREQRLQQHAAHPQAKPPAHAQPAQQPQNAQSYPYSAYMYQPGSVATAPNGSAGMHAQPTPVATSVSTAALARAASTATWPSVVRPVATTTTATTTTTTNGPTANGLTTAPAAPVPVQIPVSALSTLTQLGIVPVAEASLVPGQARPQCVMTGIQQNGAMLSLEINIGSLQSTQINGLAHLLGSLMAGRDATQALDRLAVPAGGVSVTSASNPPSSTEDSSAAASPASSS